MKAIGIMSVVIVFTGTILADTLYVWQDSPSPAAPYTSWSSAAHTIQDAVNAADTYDVIIVTNGVYNSGLTVTPGYSLQNRVMVDKAVTIMSVNGSAATIIEGEKPLGNAAVRCVYMSDNAFLSGFTLSNGHTMTSAPRLQYAGGGACINQSGTISNCVIVGCASQQYGGGVALLHGGVIRNSVIRHNTCEDNAGGIYCYNGGKVYNCIIKNNTGQDPGGVYCSVGGKLYNCLITENIGTERTGGLIIFDDGEANNCTIVSNTAPQVGGVLTQNGVSLWNCIICNNGANPDPNYMNTGSGWQYNYCCTYPSVSGSGNISDDPQFMSGSNYRLMKSSPCIDAGTNRPYVFTTKDLDGNTRIQNARVDMGAYETEIEYIAADAIVKKKGKLNVKWLRDLNDSFAMVIECEAPTNFFLATEMPYKFSFGGYMISTDDLLPDLVKINAKNTTLSFRSAKKQLPIIGLKITSKKGMIKIIAKVKKESLAKYFAAYGIDNTLKKGVLVTIPWHAVLGEWVIPVMQEPMMYKSKPDKKGSVKSM